MKKKLKELQARMKVLAFKAELSDDEEKELKDLNTQAVKLASQIDAQEAVEKAEAEEAEQAKNDRQAEIDAAVKLAVDEKEKEYATKMRRIPFGEAPYQAQFSETWKYDKYSPSELALGLTMMKGMAKESKNDLEISNAAVKALAIKLIEDKSDNGDRNLSPDYSLGAMKAAGIPTTIDGIKAVTDPMYTGGTTDGANWVHTAWIRDIWASMRSEPNIVSKLPVQIIPDGSKSVTIPIEGTDLTWYSAAEASASDATLLVPSATVGATQITTPTNKEITVGKMGARGLYSGEETEDSILDFSAQLRQQLIVSGQEQLEHAVIDGDTATGATTNVNDIGGTPTSTGISRDLFLLFDGFRKLALVTNTANSRSGGAITEDDYIETMWLLGTAGLGGADLTKCGFIISPDVYKKSLQLSSVKTKDVWSNATLEKGVLTGLWGYNLYPSWFMHYRSATRKANSAGKVDQNTVANNTTGSIISVRWDQWRFAYKRAMTIETTRIANADAYEIVAWARVGLGYRDNEASAISYNLTV